MSEESLRAWYLEAPSSWEYGGLEIDKAWTWRCSARARLQREGALKIERSPDSVRQLGQCPNPPERIECTPLRWSPHSWRWCGHTAWVSDELNAGVVGAALRSKMGATPNQRRFQARFEPYRNSRGARLVVVEVTSTKKDGSS
jgi:hypothetical protein